MVDVPVEVAMNKPMFVKYNKPIDELINLMVKNLKNFAILLDENNNPVGIVTVTDIIRYLILEKGDRKAPAYTIATKKLITITPDTSIEKALEIMKKHKISKLPIVKDGKIIGIVTENELIEILPYILDSLKELVDYLNDIISEELKEEDSKDKSHLQKDESNKQISSKITVKNK